MEPIVLDASIQDNSVENEVIVKEIQRNKILFKFPDGFNNVDVFFEASALVEDENFDVLKLLLLKYISGKRVEVYFKLDEEEVLLDTIHVSHETDNLNMHELFVQYPVLIKWMVEFFSEYVKKKPLMLYNLAIEKSRERKSGKSRKKTKQSP